MRADVAAATTIALLLVTGAARADEDLEGLLSESIVTAPSASAETTSIAPATTSVVTAEQIRAHGIRTLSEALNFLALGAFTTNPLHGQEIGVRGVLLSADYGNHVLLLVDGHTVNETGGGGASFDRGLGIPIELVDHIEVVLGPGSVLYGSNAVLGVINVVTKRAKDYPGVRLIGDADLFTWGKVGIGVGHETSFLGRPVELTAQIEYQRQEGPSLTFAPQPVADDAVTGLPKRYGPGPGTGTWGGTVKRGYYSAAPAAYVRAVSGNLELSLRASSYQRASPYLDGLVNYTATFDDPSNYELERWLFADLKYRVPVSAVVDVRTRAYADFYSYDWYDSSVAAEDCLEGQLDGCRRSLRAYSRWAGVETQANFDWLKNGRLASLVGVDARMSWVSAASHTDALGSGPSETYGRYEVTNPRIGMYTQQTAKPTSWLALNAGTRVDVAEGYPAAVSPRASVVVFPWRGGTLKGIYAQAFRAPTIYERFYTDTFRLPNTSLRPERVRSFEASFEQKLGAQRMFVAAYSTTMTDLIVSENATEADVTRALGDGAQFDAEDGRYTAHNVGLLRVVGYDAAFDGSALTGRLRYGFNVTGAYARRRAGDGSTLPPTVAPSLMGNARVSYDLANGLPVLALAAHAEARRPADRAFDSSFTPSPYAPPALDLRAAVSGPVPGIPSLSYRLVASYSVQRTGPYVIGPTQDGSSGATATLNPVDRFRTGLGLTYVFE